MRLNASPCATEPDASETRSREARSLRFFRIRQGVLGSLWGTPPALDLDAEADLHDCSRSLPSASSFIQLATSPTAASLSPSRRPHSPKIGADRRAGSVAPRSPALRSLRRTRLHSHRHCTDQNNRSKSSHRSRLRHNFLSAPILAPPAADRLEIAVDRVPSSPQLDAELRNRSGPPPSKPLSTTRSTA